MVGPFKLFMVTPFLIDSGRALKITGPQYENEKFHISGINVVEWFTKLL